MSKLAIGIYSGEFSLKKLAEKVYTSENNDIEQKDEYY